MRNSIADEDDVSAAGRRAAAGVDDGLLHDDLLHDGEQLADADAVAELEPQRQQMQDGIPICGHCGGEPIPDVNALAQERPNEHARLVAASKLFAMRPTTLARVLTLCGVERALYEERRDR